MIHIFRIVIIKKIILVILISNFQSNLYSQKKIIGKTNYYLSYKFQIPSIDSLIKKQIDSWNSKIHSVEIRQGKHASEIKTDTNGVFKFSLKNPNEKVYISVNKESKISNFNFIFEPQELDNELELNMSYSRIANHIDSLSSPVFYKKYCQKQAYIDFRNKNLKLFLTTDSISKKRQKHLSKVKKKYNIKYISEKITSVSQLSIMCRYNSIMKELIGIKRKL